MTISSNTSICIVIGDPVSHSRSPILHNLGYKALGIEDQFVFLAAKVPPAHLLSAINGARALGIRRISVTMPHKDTVMPFLDSIEETARKIGAVNTIVNDRGRLIGHNTDWLGVVSPLESITSLAGKKVCLIGAGGATRAAVFGLLLRGASVVIFNRTLEKARILAEKFGCESRPASDLKPEIVEAFDIIINTSSVGMSPDENLSPINPDCIKAKHIVFDSVYHPRITRLIRDASNRGATTIEGLEMLLHQGAAQFELYTEHKAPVDEMRKALLS